LEEVATEFDIQGLEIDWTCLAWDINLFYKDGAWNYQKFSGTSWQSVGRDSIRTYLQNAYRVLLTRARQGMIILVPYGDDHDHTRPPELYDGTFDYLKSLGFDQI
jgi:DUF2075 family protein